MNSNLITGDNVVVIAGKDKGKTGKITARNTKSGRVTVEGVNIVTKHRKPRSQKDRGGIKHEEASIDVSNVQLICPSCNKATRVGHTFDEQGKKHRICKKCDAVIDTKKTKVQKAEPKKEAKSVVNSSADKTKVEKTTANKKSVKDLRKTSEAGASKKSAARRTSPSANKVVG